jgi:hypothetical protein
LTEEAWEGEWGGGTTDGGNYKYSQMVRNINVRTVGAGGLYTYYTNINKISTVINSSAMECPVYVQRRGKFWNTM